ncbi:MAG: hypothetical protein JNJ61_09350 [Anaerolineae bacterium]|nr:hypothetical protein [Anaerolineae bacterium]
MTTTFSTSQADALAIDVDREHGGLRLSMIAIFIGLWILVFAITNSLIPSAGFNIIAGLVAFVVAAVGGRLLEPILKERWPSGRVVQVDTDGVQLRFRGSTQEHVRSNEAVSALLWRFKIDRRSRVPKGWYVVACALEQDDRFLAVYTFASPDNMTALSKLAKFSDLMSDKATKNARQDSLRIAGEQRRLRLAEQHRWNDGAEMSYEEFTRYIERLNAQFPQWLP